MVERSWTSLSDEANTSICFSDFWNLKTSHQPRYAGRVVSSKRTSYAINGKPRMRENKGAALSLYDWRAQAPIPNHHCQLVLRSRAATPYADKFT